MPDFEATFNVQTPSIEAEFDLAPLTVEAEFNIEAKVTKTSQLVNDANFQNTEQVQQAIEEAVPEMVSSDTIEVAREGNLLTLNTKTYVHEQGVASNVWVIQHNLNKKPSVTVVDTADEEQVPDRKEYNNENTITLYFLAGFKGKAYLN